MVSRAEAKLLNKDRSWVKTTLKVRPSLKNQMAAYCAENQISASVLILRAIVAMGVEVEEQDLNPTNKGGRRVEGAGDADENVKIVLPFQIRAYVRFRVAQKLRNMPDLSFTGFVVLGLEKLGFTIPQDQMPSQSRWQVDEP